MSLREEKTGKLFVGNLSSRTSKDDLYKMFADIGKISREVVIKEKGHSTFAFIEYDSARDAEEAI